ncbi:MAG: hypothetical protein IPI23_05965 [Bacteroidetes bacterium]|nr:hypothetical protein [Bacteroidota bacterium]
MPNKFYLITYFFVLIIGCTTPNNPTGIYTVDNLTNVYDTLILNKDGTYYRSLHRRKDNSLIFAHENFWQKDGSRIVLTGYFIDNDNVYNTEIANFDDRVMKSSLPLKKTNGNYIIFL